MVVVLSNSILVIKDVHENVILLWELLHVLEAFDEIRPVVEAWCKDKGLVAVLSSV
jgi:hypothetical protein